MINVSNRIIDFVEEVFDLALRLGEPPDSNLIARKLEDAKVGVHADMAIRGGMRISVDPLACIALARQGLGLVRTFEWIAKTHAGELEEVLKTYAGRTRPFYLLYPQNKYPSARVRAFVQFMMRDS